jgi:hypothetical protein
LIQCHILLVVWRVIIANVGSRNNSHCILPGFQTFITAIFQNLKLPKESDDIIRILWTVLSTFIMSGGDTNMGPEQKADSIELILQHCNLVKHC